MQWITSYTPLFIQNFGDVFFYYLTALFVPLSFSSKTKGSLYSCHSIARLVFFLDLYKIKRHRWNEGHLVLLRGPSGAHRRCGKILTIMAVMARSRRCSASLLKLKTHLFRCVYCQVLRQFRVYSFIAHQANFEHVSQKQQTFEAFTCPPLKNACWFFLVCLTLCSQEKKINYVIHSLTLQDKPLGLFNHSDIINGFFELQCFFFFKKYIQGKSFWNIILKQVFKGILVKSTPAADLQSFLSVLSILMSSEFLWIVSWLIWCKTTGCVSI